MTPFAQLGQMTKQAVPAAAGYKYQKNSAGLNDPYAPQIAKNPAKGWGAGDTALLAADVGIGSIPVLGGLWGLGRAGWDAAHGNWAGAAGNLGMAAAGAVGLGGAAAVAKTGIAAGKLGLAAGKVGLAARAANSVAKVSQGTGIAAKGAQGIMRAGQTANTLKSSGSTVFKGTPGVAFRGRQIGKIGPVTSGRAGHAAAYGAAVEAPGMVLPDGSPPPLAPPPPVAQQPAWMQQAYDMPLYGNY